MPTVGAFSAAENALIEFQKLHLTYLNQKYNKDVLDAWDGGTLDGQNALAYIGDRLGYRFLMESAKLPEKITPGRTVKFSLTLKNTGFAAVSKPCGLTAVATCGTDSFFYPITGADLQALESGGVYTLKQKIKLPGGISADCIQIGLKIGMRGGSETNFYNCIELTNEGNGYRDGVNFFCSYDLADGKYELREP